MGANYVPYQVRLEQFDDPAQSGQRTQVRTFQPVAFSSGVLVAKERKISASAAAVEYALRRRSDFPGLAVKEEDIYALGQMQDRERERSQRN